MAVDADEVVRAAGEAAMADLPRWMRQSACCSSDWPTPCGAGQDACNRLREGAAEVQRLRALLGADADLRKFAWDAESGRFEAEFGPHPGIRLLASSLARSLDGAANYVEVRLDHDDLGPLIATVQTRRGETPHDLRRAAEHRLDNVRTLLARVVPALREGQEAVVRAGRDLTRDDRALLNECVAVAEGRGP